MTPIAAAMRRYRSLRRAGFIGVVVYYSVARSAGIIIAGGDEGTPGIRPMAREPRSVLNKECGRSLCSRLRGCSACGAVPWVPSSPTAIVVAGATRQMWTRNDFMVVEVENVMMRAGAGFGGVIGGWMVCGGGVHMAASPLTLSGSGGDMKLGGKGTFVFGGGVSWTGSLQVGCFSLGLRPILMRSQFIALPMRPGSPETLSGESVREKKMPILNIPAPSFSINVSKGLTMISTSLCGATEKEDGSSFGGLAMLAYEFLSVVIS